MDDREGEDGAAAEWRFEAPAGSAGERLDRCLPAWMEERGREVSRAALQQWIRDGAVTVEGRAVKPRHAVAAGDEIVVRIPEERPAEPEPEAIEIDVLHEDEDIVVVDKQPGLVVHPGSGNAGGTLVNALLHHCGGRLCRLAGGDRPGIVHRLDKDTSGCLVAAKTERAYHSLVAQFSGRETGKEYLAVTHGVPEPREGILESRIGRHPVNRRRMAVVELPAGKEALTDYRVVRADEAAGWAAVACVIHTGRTHQIRVHLQALRRCPILGDDIYGGRARGAPPVDRLMLHARRLSFRHPATGEEMTFEAPAPSAFRPFLPDDQAG